MDFEQENQSLLTDHLIGLMGVPTDDSDVMLPFTDRRKVAVGLSECNDVMIKA